MSRAKTPEELRDDFFHVVAALARYWAETAPVESPMARCEGLVFSIMNIFDGTNMTLPAIDLVMHPHPDDKKYCEEEGDDWVAEGTVINADVMMHELWIDYQRRQPVFEEEPDES